jgi:hypothetical protein
MADGTAQPATKTDAMVLTVALMPLIMAAPEHPENPLCRWPSATPEGWYKQ